MKYLIPAILTFLIGLYVLTFIGCASVQPTPDTQVFKFPKNLVVIVEPGTTITGYCQDKILKPCFAYANMVLKEIHIPIFYTTDNHGNKVPNFALMKTDFYKEVTGHELFHLVIGNWHKPTSDTNSKGD